MATLAPSNSRPRPLTIGAVCRRLKDEFPEISISKIRYLEDQGLLNPRRTQGGYRLFAEDDLDRLETILRLQRDEFLPLRVIRQELTTPGAAKRGAKRTHDGELRRPEPEIAFPALCARTGVDPAFVRELEDYGLLEPRLDEGDRFYPERDAEVVVACTKLARYGLAPRNLRAFRTGADRNAGLLEQLVAPALRSRNPERRQAGIEDLEALAALAQELSGLLFARAVRTIAAR
jgi:DNA-binding transcriptional MerR regulator